MENLTECWNCEDREWVRLCNPVEFGYHHSAGSPVVRFLVDTEVAFRASWLLAAKGICDVLAAGEAMTGTLIAVSMGVSPLPPPPSPFPLLFRLLIPHWCYCYWDLPRT